MKNEKFGWLKCIKNYRFHSIFFKNLLLVFGAILLPLIGLLGVSSYMYGELQKSEERAYTEEVVTRITMDVENLFDEISDKAIMMSSDKDVELFFCADTIDDDEFYNVNNIFKFVSLYSITTDVIDSVYLYAPHSNAVISSSGRFAYEGFYDQACIDAWQEDGGKYQIVYLNRDIIRKKKETVSFYYKTKQLANCCGAIIVNIDVEKLDQELNYEDDVELKIFGAQQVLYDSVEEHRGVSVKEHAGFMEDDSAIVISKKLDAFDLKLACRINRQPLYEKLTEIGIILVFVVIIVIMISLLLVFYISKKIFDPISELLKVLNDRTTIDEDTILNTQNEIIYIRNTLYDTLSRNQDIEEELIERVTLLRKAQAVALQAQINPHFINNTLETINWMVLTRLKEENEISEMINCLSQLLRITLDDSDTFVTIWEEVEYVKKYLYIQQIRFQNKFEVIWQIPEELKNCKMVKMLLQPIVENAINYGIKPNGKYGKIVIGVYKAHEKVCIFVEDSGLGLSQQEVDTINAAIKGQVIKTSDHIGLSNVNQRIILAFGDEYGVTLESRFGVGTKVNIELPYQI